MSSNQYNEVPYASRNDWLTQHAAAKIFNVRYRQVTGWVYNGHVVTCKHGNKRLVSEQSCQQHYARAQFRDERSRAGHTRTSPPPEPAPKSAPEPPPIHCEVVPIQVGGAELAGIRLNGQEVIAAQLLEKILQLQPRSISTRLGRSGRFVEGVDYVVLRGRAMKAVREGGVDLESTPSPENVSQLTVLTEVGVGKVMCTMKSPVTDVLAGMLYGSNFMRRAARAVMQGDEEAFARNMADDHHRGESFDVEKFKQEMLADTRKLVQVVIREVVPSVVRETVVALLPELLKGVQATRPPTGSTDKQYRCNMRGETVARLVRQNVLGVKMTATGVHALRRSIEKQRLGLNNHGSGIEGYCELRDTGESHDVWFYSPAMVKLMCDIMRNGQVYMGFVQ